MFCVGKRLEKESRSWEFGKRWPGRATEETQLRDGEWSRSVTALSLLLILRGLGSTSSRVIGLEFDLF